jgi:hypothetical protein
MNRKEIFQIIQSLAMDGQEIERREADFAEQNKEAIAKMDNYDKKQTISELLRLYAQKSDENKFTLSFNVGKIGNGAPLVLVSLSPDSINHSPAAYFARETTDPDYDGDVETKAIAKALGFEP